MEWNDILSQIDFDESLSETEEISLRNILEDAYKRSSILRNYFSQFFARTDIRSHLPLVFAKGKKDICKHEIDKEDKSHYYRIELKLDSISSGYISEYGIVIKDSKVSILIHELCHALLGTHDNWIGDPNYTGENIRKANLVYEQLGITKQLSYPGISSSLQIGYSYPENSNLGLRRSQPADARASFRPMAWNTSMVCLCSDLSPLFFGHALRGALATWIHRGCFFPSPRGVTCNMGGFA